MKSKLEILLLTLLTLAFAVVSALLFFPQWPAPLLFSGYLFVVLLIQVLGRPAYSFTLTGFATLLGFFTMARGGDHFLTVLPILILTLWGGAFLLHLHQERIHQQFQHRRNRRDTIEHETQIIKKEISFYEERTTDLTNRSHQRQHLVAAAHSLGACLNPSDIQARLIEIGQSLFPGRRVVISVGENPDPVDEYILRQKQPLLIPTKMIPGEPLMAVPIKAQGAVAGILRVGGGPGAQFLPEDIRLLDILGSLASLALENSHLFYQVQETALRDNLTGLWTRRAFQDVLDNALLEASRYNTQVSIILADVDHFKAVNDSFGHQAGDQVLHGFSQNLLRHVREVDVVGRYGGEEFIILLLQTPHREAVQLAEQIRIDMERQRIQSGDAVISVTGSFGVSTFPDEATSAQQLIRLADERLYGAKNAGRNRVMGQAA